ncbi:hypothetical protein ATCV1_z196R [Acanthocystis turfacea chlorella virus 1]|uniref:Uncharacterized protein z196R n=1 Tax=Chlorovirus heliozoae TaxID=322019 RepID=A7K8F6_9PHYC|nr:hypothetical protein ATCV1_z196R [Acanthocystis turfacea chlorella virus 1]ABT16330.1 hypothetical protein ATCV1_z196R [Acanthocystis turfacea chlorella virus 1]
MPDVTCLFPLISQGRICSTWTALFMMTITHVPNRLLTKCRAMMARALALTGQFSTLAMMLRFTFALCPFIPLFPCPLLCLHLCRQGTFSIP